MSRKSGNRFSDKDMRKIEKPRAHSSLLLAPANTPAELLDKLNGAAQQALESPDVSGKLRAISQAVAGGTRTQAVEAVHAEAKQWKQLISERNIQLAR